MTNLWVPPPGWAWSVTKEPQFKTDVQKSISGRELRLTFQALPTWLFTLTFSFLRDQNDTRGGAGPGTGYNELRAVMGFFLQQQGMLTPFYFDDPTDDLATAQPILNTNTALPTGDGTTTTFQLVRTMGNFLEPIIAPNTITACYVNGVSKPYTLGANGVVTFTTAPGNGTTVTATFSYYFLCRFGDDTISFENFLYQLWELKQLKFQSVLV